MKTLGYIRVSTEEQSARGASLDVQTEKIQAYCKMHDLELTEIVNDGGWSARTLKRPGMRRILHDLTRSKRGWNLLIVHKLDRLTRSVKDLGRLIELFDKAGAALASISEHIDATTAGGRLVLNVLGSVSQWEREATAERTAAALQHRRREGRKFCRIAPYGYRWDGNLMIADPAEQDAIRLMQIMAERGMSLSDIADNLSEMGIAPREARQWNRGVINEVLKRSRVEAESAVS